MPTYKLITRNVEQVVDAESADAAALLSHYAGESDPVTVVEVVSTDSPPLAPAPDTVPTVQTVSLSGSQPDGAAPPAA
jgi:hypothetical protein